ncbi:MAG: SBBP repeat-containing protein [Candidatus Hodarchaeota archaeon]
MDWSYLLGGTEEDKSSDISTDSQDNVIITGVTSSSDFPRLNSQSSFTNLTSKNAFLTKFLPDGSIVWSKLLGGNDIDKANGLSVDSQDNIIFTGITLSNDFPVLNAYDSSPNLYMDAFLSKVAPNGDLLWSTYLGGSYADHGNSIAIDTQDNIAVVGTTYSSDFAEDTALGGTFIVGGSAYIVKFFPNGSQIILKQRFSGRNGAFGSIVTFDSMDNMLISGTTPSADFPTLNAYNSTISGSSDTFLLKLSQDNSLLWSTFLGGIGEETQICP